MNKKQDDWKADLTHTCVKLWVRLTHLWSKSLGSSTRHLEAHKSQEWVKTILQSEQLDKVMGRFQHFLFWYYFLKFILIPDYIPYI